MRIVSFAVVAGIVLLYVAVGLLICRLMAVSTGAEMPSDEIFLAVATGSLIAAIGVLFLNLAGTAKQLQLSSSQKQSAKDQTKVTESVEKVLREHLVVAQQQLAVSQDQAMLPERFLTLAEKQFEASKQLLEITLDQIRRANRAP